MNSTHKRPRISSVVAKIIAVNILSLFICTAALGIFNYGAFRNDSLRICGDKAMSIAQSIAAFINGDRLQDTVRSGEKSESWLREKAAIDEAMLKTGIAYVFVVSSDYDDDFKYYMGASYEGKTLDLGDADKVSNYAAEILATFRTGLAASTGVHDSATGNLLVTGSAAVRDNEGRIVGVVGVSVLADELFGAARVWEFVFRTVVTFAICSIAPILLQIFLFRRMIGRPVKELTAASAKIGGGDLDVSLSVKTGDEIEVLAGAFVKMAAQLKAYIDNLTRVTAEKERIGAELDVAAKIQASMLPCIFPAFPDRAEFDIYASMLPAKEVGGDFYDFFFIDDSTLAVVMADVSGKGVPAALFMVIAKTLIHNNAQNGKSPKEVFETANNLLCENNDAGMFVTAVLGYLDIPTGRFVFVNAGHNPPLLRTGGCFEWLKTKPGFVLAGMDDIQYKEHEIILHPGDALFLYTDGITEAVNNENKLFGDPRLLKTVNQYLGLPLCEFTVSVKREIDRFTEGAEQADDITMLSLLYKGGTRIEG